MRQAFTRKQSDRMKAAAYRKAILAAMGEEEMTQEALAEKMGMARATLRARLRDTDTLTRGEDRRLRQILRMEDET